MDNPDVPFDLTRRGEQRAATTSPIYARDRDGRVEGVGSGVFVEHGGRAFVVTASHVLTHYINSHELHTGGRFTLRINQRFFPSKDEDRYDVGFIPLTDAQRADLADVTFVTTDRLDLSDEAPEASYCIVGYRADDNSPEGTPSHVVAGWSVYAARSAPLDTYRQRQLSPADRLLLKFDRRQLFGADRAPVETEDEPEGLSGAGVWSLTATPESDKLVAIVESHTDSGRLLYAARLRVLVNSLEDFVGGRLS
jgi:hypothetical protein